MKSFVVTSVLLLTLVLTSVTVAEAQARKVLRPSELCSENPPTAIATFEDADLEAVVRTALSVSAREDLTCGLVSGLTRLTARPGGRNQVFVVYGAPRPRDGAIPEHPFESLVGIQNLTSLTNLTINDRSLTDISPLSGLTSLTSLQLHTNRIRDLSPLSGLTGLTQLTLSENLITDLSALSGLTNLTVLRLHARQRFDVLGDLAELRVGNLRRRKHRHEAQRRPGLPFHLSRAMPGQTRRDCAALTL